MNLAMEKLMSREQKEEIITTLLAEGDFKGPIKLRYDRRFGWDFEVKRMGDGGARITFSVPVTSPRLRFTVKECIRAIKDVQLGSTSARKVRQARPTSLAAEA